LRLFDARRLPHDEKKSFPKRHKAKQGGNTKVKSGNLTAVT